MVTGQPKVLVKSKPGIISSLIGRNSLLKGDRKRPNHPTGKTVKTVNLEKVWAFVSKALLMHLYMHKDQYRCQAILCLMEKWQTETSALQIYACTNTSVSETKTQIFIQKFSIYLSRQPYVSGKLLCLKVTIFFKKNWHTIRSSDFGWYYNPNCSKYQQVKRHLV